ncbi:MAG: hypothetical protein WD294_14660 [Phycisphaeraceae bacterium]
MAHEDDDSHQQGGGGMHQRGVTRPMAMQAGQSHSDHGPPYSDARHHMVHMHHQQTLWIYWLLVLLGLWMLIAPLTFDYGKNIVDPSGGRSVWLSDDARVMALTLSDIVTGLLLIIFGWRSLTPNRPVSLWLCCVAGIWLTFAPVIFWAPTAAAYLNSTIIGALVISLTIIIPGMPNMPLYMHMGGDTPPGWSYNPSSWPQRAILLALAFLGWLVSLIVLPWIISGDNLGGRLNALVVGLLVIALSIPRGVVTERFAGWDRYIK